jgi:hypothetical protein
LHSDERRGYHSWARCAYSSHVPAAVIPSTGAANHLSLSFNGADQAITFPGEWPFNTGDATLQFWMKYNDTQNNQEIFWTRLDATDSDRFNIVLVGPDGNATCPSCTDGDFFSDYRDPSGNLHDLVSGAYISPGVWHFVAFVKSGDEYSMYLDGNLEGTASQNAPLPDNTGWTISGRGTLYYDGELDEVQLSNVALSPTHFESVLSAAPNDTRITKTALNAKKRTATFRFAASGTISGFQCARIKPGQKTKPKFVACRSPKSYQHLSAKSGHYVFEVRAINSVGTDPELERLGIGVRSAYPERAGQRARPPRRPGRWPAARTVP